MRMTLLLKAFNPQVGQKDPRFRCIDEEYEIGDRIDKDASLNAVRLGRRRKTGESVAIKAVLKRSRAPQDQEEIVFRQMMHPNLVRLIDVFENRKVIYFVMERCSGGDLVDLVEQNNGRLCQDDVIVVFRQLVQAVDFMHSKNIVHSDLKPSNIMISTDLTLKLIDFGASHVTNQGSCTPTQGSPEFLAPEVVRRSEISLKSDIWALGLILFIMTIGFSPFNPQGKPYHQIRSAIYKLVQAGFENRTGRGYGAFFPEAVPCSPEMKTLIASMLLYDPLKRPSISAILQDPLLRISVKEDLCPEAA